MRSLDNGPVGGCVLLLIRLSYVPGDSSEPTSQWCDAVLIMNEGVPLSADLNHLLEMMELVMMMEECVSGDKSSVVIWPDEPGFDRLYRPKPPPRWVELNQAPRSVTRQQGRGPRVRSDKVVRPR